jgi:EAL and modified HD-GYP domain-containing signal transduction protein
MGGLSYGRAVGWPTFGVMSANPLPLEPAEHELEVFISRQPVVDSELRVNGYRVAYATAEGEDIATPGEQSASRLFGDVLSVVGLQELVGARLAHLPVSSELLKTLGIPPIRPDRVMLRFDYATANDLELRPLLEGLANRGYSLALHDLPSPEFDSRLLDLFGTVEVDFSAWEEPEARQAAEVILAGWATPLAVGLGEHEDFERAKGLGFQMFSGPFFASPGRSAVPKIPGSGVGSLVSLARLQGDSAAIEELEQVINQDVGLSVKLLRYINSAYFGMRSNITSIRQAVMMLGGRGVSRWALMVALTGGPSTPRELAVMALTRARMCEILGMGQTEVSADELFTIGLLSSADALLDRPLETIVPELPLADEVSQALLQRAGPAGPILDAVLAYELANFGAESVQLHRTGVATAYMDALKWAQETIAAVA